MLVVGKLIILGAGLEMEKRTIVERGIVAKKPGRED